MERGKRKGIIGIIICVLILAIVFFVYKTVQTIYVSTNTTEETKSVSEHIADASEIIANDIIGSEGTISTVEATPSLDDLISISNLQSLSYNYNSICSVEDDDGNLLYHVSYRGTVVLGIDMDLITWDTDENSKTIIFSLPPVECQSCTVDATSLSYIFADDDYNTPSVGAQAQALCLADLEEKIADPDLNETMFTIAKENCETGIYGMFQPLINQYFPEYTMEVVFN